ncbi:MAG: 4Fe-4S dicluster domain-containing protein [bacterium]
MDKVIEKTELNKIISHLLKSHLVIATTKPKGKEKNIRDIGDPEEIDWGIGNSPISSKHLFFPQSEVLFSFMRKQNDVKITEVGNHNKSRILIGIRPCDAAAMTLLDNVFGGDYVDPLFCAFRKKTFIISLACNEPEDSCFCTSVDLSPYSEKGSDILLCDIGNGKFFAHIITESAQELYAKFEDKFKEPTQEDIIERERRTEDALAKLYRRFPIKDIKAWLDRNFESPLWEVFAPECIGCGTCTFLCPTCHCFDIVDEAQAYTGERRKNWDSCAFEHFTQMQAHQPRPFQWQRFRQRIMHKFKYFVDRFSEVACVGCGRCRTKCPVNIDIIDVIKRIEQENRSDGSVHKERLAL